MKNLPRLCLLSGLLLSLLAACGPAPLAIPTAFSPAPLTASETFPTGGWQTSSPTSQGMDPQLLDQVLAAIRDEKINLHSLLVIRHGLIVSENYFQGQTASTRHELYSVTKSFTGTLVGIAADRGWLDIHSRVLAGFPGTDFANVDERKQAMTAENLLTMTAGLDWSEADPTYTAMYRSSNWVKYVLDLPMAAVPGSVFLYNSGASHVLSALINLAVQPQGLDTFTFAQQSLFDPLGIDARWDRDSQGVPIGGWGLQITPRDMAKLGYLYLHNGQWEGRQIVPAEWVQAATQKQAPAAPGELGYGYQWWVYPLKGAYARFPAYAALGRFGQTILVVPGLDLVVVTTAQTSDHDPIFSLVDRYIVPAVPLTE